MIWIIPEPSCPLPFLTDVAMYQALTSAALAIAMACRPVRP
ncbi:MAG: hypothetical protein Q4B13_02070 [Lautropia sp.]|nr:hypothetical protein [Lautropia sp.]